MKILYITAENIYGTGSSNIRNVSMIEGISSQGHDVSILSFEVNENAKKYDEKIKEKLVPYKKFLLHNHSIQKLFTIKKSENSNRLLSNIKHYIYRLAKKVYLRFTDKDTLAQAVSRINLDELPDEQYDIVISSSDPISSHALAEKFFEKSRNSCRWIQYWGDPLYLDITRTNTNKNKLKRTEQYYLDKADKIVYTNPLITEEQKEIYPNNANKMFFVPTPFSFYRKEDRKEIRYDIGYFGSYMECVRDIMPLCNAAIENNKRLIIMGGGDQAIPESDNIEVWPFQSTSIVAEYESQCAILACICNTSKTGRTVYQVPGKIYHYAVTDKPVLIIGADDSLRGYLKQFNRFVFCDNDDIQIKIAMESILAGNCTTDFSPIKSFLPHEIAGMFVSEVPKGGSTKCW